MVHKKELYFGSFLLMMWNSKKLKLKDLKCLIKNLYRTTKARKVWQDINIQADYVLCHFNCYHNNLISVTQTNQLCFIDWAEYHLGFNGMEEIRLFSSYNASFSEIKRAYSYCSDIDIENRAKVNKEIVFYYWCIFRYIIKQKKDFVDEMMGSFYNPAIEHIKALSDYISEN